MSQYITGFFIRPEPRDWGRWPVTILGDDPAAATITLYGSFARTYTGHGTDKALVAGLLGLAADNPGMTGAFQLAKAAGLVITFRTSDARDRHPNTVEFLLEGKSGSTVRVDGVSVGGGRILITGIDNFKVDISGETLP